MALALKSFDIKRVIVTVNGSVISGFVDGDAVTAEYEEDQWSKTVGADGEVTRVKQNRRDGMITIRLNQTARSNKDLDRFARIDDETDLFPVTIVIQDTLNGDRVIGNQCWLKKLPALGFGRELAQREWVYDVAELVLESGGGFPI